MKNIMYLSRILLRFLINKYFNCRHMNSECFLLDEIVIRKLKINLFMPNLRIESPKKDFVLENHIILLHILCKQNRLKDCINCKRKQFVVVIKINTLNPTAVLQSINT